MKHMGSLKWAVGIFVLTVGVMFSGCSALNTGKGGSAGGSVKAESKGPVPTYALDFGDVLIPAELKVVKKESFVYRTNEYAAGVMVYKGRVTAGSLLAFFETNMPTDGWDLVCEFKSNRSVMLFKKQSRWCVINVTDRTGGVDVEIWVAPTLGEATAKSNQATSEGLFK